MNNDIYPSQFSQRVSFFAIIGITLLLIFGAVYKCTAQDIDSLIRFDRDSAVRYLVADFNRPTFFWTESNEKKEMLLLSWQYESDTITVSWYPDEKIQLKEIVGSNFFSPNQIRIQELSPGDINLIHIGGDEAVFFFAAGALYGKFKDRFHAPDRTIWRN